MFIIRLNPDILTRSLVPDVVTANSISTFPQSSSFLPAGHTLNEFSSGE